MFKAATLCTTFATVAAIGGLPGIPGIPGVPGGFPTPGLPATAPIPIARNGAPVGTFGSLGSGSDEVAGVIGSFWPLPKFLMDSSAYLPSVPWAPDQGFKFSCPIDNLGETLPCVYYIVFQHCGTCTEPTNGGFPTNLTPRPEFSFERSCSPRYAPIDVVGESYPTAFFKGVVGMGQEVEVFLDRPATAFAVFDGTTSQCRNLLSSMCLARSDCAISPSGECVDASSVCPPRIHKGPFQNGGTCPSCWEGGANF
eukprot:TRINITY_DN20761_c0_g1_i1.p1 TRINITY_DN20761_c0_g1~~TRINITY_DN20761_c0_g1_i1.p1  ORF type:complete len:254 (+),score=40.36 TRINITY_DN20761_c0_g1_i1:68-829(+)